MTNTRLIADRATAKSSLYIVSLGLTWGVSVAVIKSATATGIAEMQIIAVTAIPIAVALYGILRLQGRPLPATVDAWGYCAVCAFLIAVAPVYLTFLVLPHISLGLFSVIIATSSLITFAFSLVLGEDRFSWLKLGGITVGLIAVGVILVPQVDWNAQRFNAFVPLAFIIPVIYSTYDVFASRFWPTGGDAIGLAFGETLIAVVLTLPLAWLSWNGETDVTAWQGGWRIVAVLAAIWVFERILFFAAIRLAGAILAATAAYLATATGIVLGMVLFDEPFDPVLWLSFALLVVAIGLVSVQTRERQR